MSSPISLTGTDIQVAGAANAQDSFTSEEITSLIGEALAREDKGEEAAPEPGPAPEEKAAEPPAEPEVDVPGVGKLKVSQIRGLMAQRAAFESIRREKDALEAKASEVEQLRSEAEQTRYLRGLLDHKAFRDKMQQALAEFVGSPALQATGPDGKSGEFFQVMRNPEVDELREKFGLLEGYINKVQEKEAASEIGGIISDYASRYPFFDKALQQTVIDSAVDHFHDQAKTFEPRQFKAYVQDVLQDQILEHERQKARDEVLAKFNGQPGARVVTGTGTRASAKPPQVDWAKKDWREISQSMANDLRATE